MQLVLRIHTIRPGELDEWLRELGPDPARHIAEARQLPVRAVDVG